MVFPWQWFSAVSEHIMVRIRRYTLIKTSSGEFNWLYICVTILQLGVSFPLSMSAMRQFYVEFKFGAIVEIKFRSQANKIKCFTISSNGSTVEVRDWMCNFIPHFIKDTITHPCWDQRLSMAVKGFLIVQIIQIITKTKPSTYFLRVFPSDIIHWYIE